MTVEELQTKLLGRGLALDIHSSEGDDGWVVWLHAQDDPAIGVFPGEGTTLELAIADAFEAWDQGGAKEVEPRF